MKSLTNLWASNFVPGSHRQGSAEVDDIVATGKIAIELARRAGGNFELDDEVLKRRGLTNQQITTVHFRLADIE
jgi:hypothetical protein